MRRFKQVLMAMLICSMILSSGGFPDLMAMGGTAYGASAEASSDTEEGSAVSVASGLRAAGDDATEREESGDDAYGDAYGAASGNALGASESSEEANGGSGSPDIEETLTNGEDIVVHAADAASAPYKYYVERNTGANGESFNTLAEAIDSINNRAYPCNLYIGEDCTLNSGVSFTSTRNYAVTIFGNDHKITGGAGVSGALISYNRTAALTIDGLTINGGQSSGSLLVKSSTGAGNITLTNVTLNGQSAEGALLSDAGTGAWTISNSRFNGPTADTDSDLVSKSNNGAVTFTNCTFTRNQSRGAGFIKSGTGAVAITGCTFDGSDNAEATASLIKVGTGALTLIDTVVKNHSASNASPAVDASAVSGTNNLKVSGSTNIIGNTCNDGSEDANLAVPATATIFQIAGTLSKEIGVTGTNFVLNTKFAQRSGNTVAGLDNLKADNHPGWLAEASGNTDILWREYICQVNNNGTITKYMTIQEAYNAAPDGGTIEMLVDTSVGTNTAFNIEKTVTLTTAAEYAGSGDSAVISRHSSFTGNSSMFTVSKGTVKLENITLDGSSVRVNKAGSIIEVTAAAAGLELNDGAILQNGFTSFGASGGGAIYMSNGSVAMNNGSIIQNCDASGDGGGGVYLAGGTLTMNAGSTIRDCIASGGTDANGKGGGVCVNGASALFTMEGGVIEGCEATRSLYFAGGGVCMFNGNFIMNDGTIRDCHATAPAGTGWHGGWGGALAINHGKKSYINGGLITGCTATKGGAAVECHEDLYMTGGTITANNGGTANGESGAVNFYDSGSRLFVHGSPKIYGNYDVNGNYNDVAIRSNGGNITVDGDLNDDAIIGVNKEGTFNPDEQFGLFSTDNIPANLDIFFADLDDSLVGMGFKNSNSASGKWLIWARGFRVVAKMYTDDPANAIEIKGSRGSLTTISDFDGTSTETEKTVTLSIEDAEAQYKTSRGFGEYLKLVDPNAEFQYARLESGTVPDNITYLRSKLIRSGSKRSFHNYYSINASTASNPNQIHQNQFTELDTAETIVLYYKISPKVKITEPSGELLSYDSYGNPAIFGSLEKAFEYIPRLYHASGSSYTTYSGDEHVKMLVDSLELEEGCAGEGDFDVTLTTAETTDSLFPGPGGTCVISNGGITDKSMITSRLSNLTLDKITLDGKNRETSSNGALVNVNKSGSALTVQNGATLKNGRSGGRGGAVYLTNGAVMNMTGGVISGNSSEQGGAVNVGGNRSRLNFSGSPTVYDNPGGSGDQKNVYLDVNSNAVINMTGAIGSPYKVGVYVPDDLLEARGVGGVSFGTSEGKPDYAKIFKNDRDEELFGSYKSSNSRLYWNLERTVMVPLIIQKQWSDLTIGAIGGDYSNAEVSFTVYGKKGDEEEALKAYSVSSPKSNKRVSTLKKTDTCVIGGETVEWARLVYVPRKNAAEENYDSYFIRETGNTAAEGSLVNWGAEYSAEKGTWQEVTDGYVDGYIKLHRTSLSSGSNSAYENVKHVEFYFWDSIDTKDNYYCAQVDLDAGNLLTWKDEGYYYIKVRLPASLDPDEARLIFDGYNGSGNPRVLTLANEESLKSGVTGHGFVYGIVTCTTAREVSNPDGAPAFRQADMTTAAPSFDEIEFLSTCPEDVTAKEGAVRLHTFPHEQTDAQLIVTNNAYICKIEDSNSEGGVKADGRDVYEHGFPTLNKAVAYARAKLSGTAKIEMLVDYEIPKGDLVTLDKAKDNITITTAATSGGVYNFKPAFTAAQGRRTEDVPDGDGNIVTPKDSAETAILKRGWDGGNNAAEALFYVNYEATNANANLTTENIIFDGEDSNEVNEETGALIQHTGRAVHVNTGDLTVTDGSTFRNFSTPNVGGAIYSAQVKNTKIQGSESSAILFENCRATGSASDYDGGGAISFVQRTSDAGKVEGATFIDCYTNAAGGAIYVRTQSGAKTFLVTNCVFDGHEDLERIAATTVNAKWGGAIYIWDGSFSMTDCDFTDCTATEDGGAVSVHSGGGDKVELIENCSFNGHDTLPDTIMNAKTGGAIGLTNVSGGTDSIQNITVTNCRTSGLGGGMYVAGSNTSGVVRKVDGEINFSNCYTTNGSGGGIYFSSTVTIADTARFTFDNCHAGGSASSSGAIYFNYSFGKNMTITGAKFTDCSAGNLGGCLYVKNDGGKYTRFVSCEFNGHDDFDATTLNSNSGDKGGGGIYVYDGSLELVDCTLTNLTAKGKGGAICMDGGGSDYLSLTDCTIDGNDGKLTEDGVTVKNASAGGGIWINADNGTNLNNVTIKNCQAGGDGGGIYDSDPFTETTGTVLFENCFTTGGKGGGAFFNSTAAFGKSGTTGNTVTFKGCHTDSTSTANGGGGAWFNSTVMLQSGTELDFDACYSASYGGGAWFNAATTLSSAPVSFTDCYAAKRGGGAYFANSATLNNTVTFNACHTDTAGTGDGGGGVWFNNSAMLNANAEVSFDDCYTTSHGGGAWLNGAATVNADADLSFENCYAGKNGGGAYFAANTAHTLPGVSFTNCKAGWAWDEDAQDFVSVAGGSGGGLYKVNNTLTMTDTTFTGCCASANGGAICYAASTSSGTALNLNSGTSITGCTVEDGGRGSAIYFSSSGPGNFNGGTTGGVNGVIITGNRGAGAVEVNSNSSILTFGGNVLLYNNYENLESGTDSEGGSDSDVQKNLVLDRNTNTVIKTSATGLGADAHIGVYVTGTMTGTQTEPYKSHGKQNQPFGTWQTTDVNLDKFTNDRHDDLFGVSHSGDKLIYWAVSGSRRVILRKVGSNFSPQQQTFDICTTGSTTPVSNELSGIRSRPSGVIYIGELSYGTYDVIETSVNPRKIFTITVDANGVGYRKNESDTTYSREVRAKN